MYFHKTLHGHDQTIVLCLLGASKIVPNAQLKRKGKRKNIFDISGTCKLRNKDQAKDNTGMLWKAVIQTRQPVASLTSLASLAAPAPRIMLK